jgi:putative transposase
VFSVNVSAGHWYISFKYEAPTPQVEKTGEVVGVDLGIHHLATCSGGEVFPNPKPYRKAQRRLVRLQRRLSRKQKGSANRKKAVVQLGKAHKRVADIRTPSRLRDRQDNLHKPTTYLAKRYRVVVVEDLQVKNLLQNRKLAGSLSDCGFYELRTPSRYRERRQLEYKARLYGCQVVVADKFYPSSQLCSGCGHRQKMPLQERVFCCPCCGLELDRDLNAALNLLRWYRTTPSSGGSDACGDSSGGVVGVNSAASHGSLKQEESSDAGQSSVLFSVA